MNDPMNRFEAEMGAMRPVPISGELTGRIEAAIAAGNGRGSPWPDRFLWSAICSGALAACVIVAVLLDGGPDSPRSMPSMEAMNPTPHVAGFAATPLAFLRADPMWVEMLK